MASSLRERPRSEAFKWRRKSEQPSHTPSLHWLVGKATGTVQGNRKSTGCTEEVIMPIRCF